MGAGRLRQAHNAFHDLAQGAVAAETAHHVVVRALGFGNGGGIPPPSSETHHGDDAAGVQGVQRLAEVRFIRAFSRHGIDDK